MTDDNQILIRPDTSGIILQFNMLIGWDNNVRIDIPNFEWTAENKIIIGGALKSMGCLLLGEEQT